MSGIADLRTRIATLTSPDGGDALTAFTIEGFIQRHPIDWRQRWNQKCGAIDTLLDLECGFVDFFQKVGSGRPPSFFEAFGFLQALVVQQDAVFWLGRSMGFHKNAASYSELKNIRDIRNRAVGHPAYTDKADNPSSGMWNPAEIDENGFNIILYYDDFSQNTNFNYQENYEINDSNLSVYLCELINWMIKIDRSFQSHKAQSAKL